MLSGHGSKGSARVGDPMVGDVMSGPSLVPFRRSVVVTYALVAPLAVAAAVHALDLPVTATTAALVLVLVVVSAAATGQRAAGVLAALSAGIWFDFFLTAPYLNLKVTDADDIEATVLLLCVGLAVSEIALWGTRQHARASRRAGYLAGVFGTEAVVAERETSGEALIARVREQVVEVLDIDECHFEPDGARHGRAATTLERDGSVRQAGRQVDVERDGLPADDLISLEVAHEGVGYGRFVLTAATRIRRPTLEQRRVVVLLADQVGIALAGDAVTRRGDAPPRRGLPA